MTIASRKDSYGPCLLLLLRRRTGHGYDLVERLKTLGVTDGDSDGVYRTLRSMERDALVQSDWTPGSADVSHQRRRVTQARLDAAAGKLQRPSSVGAVARPSGPLS